jgi:hypothetical protein
MFTRCRLPPEAANTKFIESMMLIAKYREEYEKINVGKTGMFLC